MTTSARIRRRRTTRLMQCAFQPLRSRCNSTKSMASDSSKTVYRPGETVPKAGIYKVTHAQHRLPHKASFKAQEKFPMCNKCATLVRFELLIAVAEEEGQPQKPVTSN